MKELEALVNKKIEYYKAVLSLSVAIGRLEEPRRLKETIGHFEEIKQALTPPTAEEVCKALSEYLKCKTRYHNNNFNLWDEDGFVENITTLWKSDNDIFFTVGVPLPPHLITLIGRFYEGVKE